MAGAVTSTVENLITRVSMEGAKRTENDMNALGAGFRLLRGDIRGAASAIKGLGAAAIGGGMIAAGAGVVGYLRTTAAAANESAEVQRRLRVAMTASGQGGAAAARDIGEYANKLKQLTAVDDEAITNAAAMLATFKMSKEEINAYLPRILDMQEGLKKLGGEEMSLEQIAIMLGKGHSGMISGLRKVGVMVDENAYKQKGYKAILEEVDKEFGGQAAEAAKGYTGRMKQLDIAIGDFNETMGAGLLPILTATTGAVRPIVNGLTALNEMTHGAAGVMLAAGAAALVLGGGIVVVYNGVRTLKQAWLEVTGAANAAAAAQTRAVAAGAGAGAAGTVVAGGGAAGGAGAAGTVVAGGGAAGGAGWKGKAIGIGKGIAGIAAMIGGGALVNWGNEADARAKKRGRATWGDATQVGTGVVGGRAIEGVGIGMLGGSTGAAIGAILGGGYGLYEVIRMGKENKKAFSKASGGGKDPAETTNNYLKQLVQLASDQKAIAIGGGPRAGRELSNGDVQRAFARVMARGIA